MLMSLFSVADLLLRVLGWIIIGQVILSWLVAFNVLNTSSQGLRAFVRALDRIIDPLYRPIRKVMPDFGGIDFSPLVLLLLIQILRMLLSGVAVDVAYGAAGRRASATGKRSRPTCGRPSPRSHPAFVKGRAALRVLPSFWSGNTRPAPP